MSEATVERPGQMQLETLDSSAFRALATLANAGMVTATQLDLSTESGKLMSYDRWGRIGRYLGAMNRACSWWVGDWLLYGENGYGDEFHQAADETGLSPETLRNRMYICRAIPPSRRRPSLSFSTHGEVAALPAHGQRRWLDRAERNGWSRAELRGAMADDRRKKSAENGDDLGIPPAGEPLAPAIVLEAAKRVVGSKVESEEDPSAWLVPREAMARLAAAVGDEE